MSEGALASCMAAVFSNPFEVMKTRLQLQGELQKKGHYVVEYRGMIHGMIKIAREEGIHALQKGILASFAHQTVQNGVRLGCYPAVKELCTEISGRPGFATNIVAGALIGVFSAVVSSPFFLVKTRLQAQSNVASSGHAVGVQHHYTGVRHALYSIYAENGMRGLFHGVRAAGWRTGVGSASQLATYDGSKAHAMGLFHLPADDFRVHLAAASLAAMAITVTMNPLDVVMTRSYNSNATNAAYGNNMLSALLQVLRVEGLEGLYKGSSALWARTAPHTVCTFLFLEQIRTFRKLTLDMEGVAVEG